MLKVLAIVLGLIAAFIVTAYVTEWLKEPTFLSEPILKVRGYTLPILVRASEGLMGIWNELTSLATEMSEGVYQSIRNLPRDLTPNLISEAIGIIVTVFIIDRIIKWRENRRWHDARDFFRKAVGSAGDEIVNAWSKWLIDFDKGAAKIVRGRKSRKPKASDSPFLGSGFLRKPKASDSPFLGSGFLRKPKASDSPFLGSGFLRKPIGLDSPFLGSRFFPAYLDPRDHLRKYLGNPIGTTFPQFFAGAGDVSVKSVESNIRRYLAGRTFPKEKPAWGHLISDLTGPIDKLSELVKRYPNLVEPAIIVTILKLSQLLDQLESGSYGSPDYMSNIAEAIIESINFRFYMLNGRLPIKLVPNRDYIVLFFLLFKKASNKIRVLTH